MSPTYTRRAHLTTCDDCGQSVGTHWKNLAAHTAVHAAHDTTAARAARVQAMGDELACETGGSEPIAGVETDRLMGHKADRPALAAPTGPSSRSSTTRKEA